MMYVGKELLDDLLRDSISLGSIRSVAENPKTTAEHKLEFILQLLERNAEEKRGKRDGKG